MVKGEPRGFDASDLFPYFICIVYLGGETSNILGEMFTPKNLGDYFFPIWLAHIFQMGWFNHQLDIVLLCFYFDNASKGFDNKNQSPNICGLFRNRNINICFFLGLYLKDQEYSRFFVAILMCCIPRLPLAPDISRVLVAIDVVGVMFSSQIHTAYASRIYTPISVYVFCCIYIHIFDMCIYILILSYMELFNNR